MNHVKIVDAQIQNTATNIIVSLACVNPETQERFVTTVILPPVPHGVYNVSAGCAKGDPETVQSRPEHRPPLRPVHKGSNKEDKNKSRSALGWSSSAGSTGDDKRLR